MDINFDNVLENFGGDRELLLNIITLSLKLIPQHIEKIHEALNKRDSKNVEISSHTLKGSLSIYLYQPITDIAFELEKMGRSQSLENAPSTLRLLEDQLPPFYQCLEKYINSHNNINSPN